MTPTVESRPTGSYRTPDITAELADVARLIDRADAEAARLRARRLSLWREARDAGLSWRDIARASRVDHSVAAKALRTRETD